MKTRSGQLMNEDGQATTAAMVLLPVATLILTTLVILGFAFIFEANATANCRASLNESQSEARDALNHLLALNPRAEKLERARQTAKLTLIGALASGDPILAAAARAAVIAIERAQIPVIAAQIRWLARGHSASLLAADRAQLSIREALPRVLTKPPSNTSRLVRARFDVIPSGPPDARTPTYRTAPGFGKSQTAEVQWLLTLPIALPLFSNGKKLAPSINVGCAMTLTKRGAEKWSLQILEDKLLPN